MTARALLTTVCVLAALAATSTASAAAPTITDLELPLTSLGPDPALLDACGIAVDVSQEGRVRRIEYSDGTVAFHRHITYYWSANGASLTERTNFTVVVAGDETTIRGVPFNLHVPGVGPVMVEAGKVVFGPNGITQSGLHMVLDGTVNIPALCDYFDGA